MSDKMKNNEIKENKEELIHPHRSTAELAAALNVTRESITRALRAKKIKGIRVGIDWRIPQEEYERVIREGY